jgi:5-formyltetrahydrofolate cyclo-ligase
MSRDTQEAKRALRAQVQAALSRVSGLERVAASARVRALLKEQALWRQAQSVLFFAPLPQEPDIWPLLPEALADSMQVLLPRFVPTAGNYEICRIRHPDTDIQIGTFRIREPGSHCARTDLSRVDLILVPGVAFDSRGHRLGRGKGYYDRLLGTMGGVTCGVAFEEQILNKIPVELHDVHLNFIVTPERWVEVKSREAP